VIPTLLLVGLVLGRWWRVVIPAAAIGWAVLLIVTGVDSGIRFATAAALLGAFNVAVGVFVFQAARRLLHSLFMSRGETAKP
jgi:choline-glycine betaine transporter